MIKFVGADVHSASISLCVQDKNGSVLSESVVLTQKEAILDFVSGLRGEVHLAFEEGTQAHWLYWLLKKKGYAYRRLRSKKNQRVSDE